MLWRSLQKESCRGLCILQSFFQIVGTVVNNNFLLYQVQYVELQQMWNDAVYEITPVERRRPQWTSLKDPPPGIWQSRRSRRRGFSLSSKPRLYQGLGALPQSVKELGREFDIFSFIIAFELPLTDGISIWASCPLSRFAGASSVWSLWKPSLGDFEGGLSPPRGNPIQTDLKKTQVLLCGLWEQSPWK